MSIFIAPDVWKEQVEIGMRFLICGYAEKWGKKWVDTVSDEDVLTKIKENRILFNAILRDCGWNIVYKGKECSSGGRKKKIQTNTKHVTIFKALNVGKNISYAKDIQTKHLAIEVQTDNSIIPLQMENGTT